MAITPNQWSHVLTIPESYTPSSATSGQTLVITESVIAKLSTVDQSTFWSNVQNGGGDVRICTDEAGANQLPVDLVSLDNVAKTCVIWTRKATYDGTGDLYVFIGKAGETQPPVTGPFGRNAVWVDYEAVLHLSENTTNGVYSDSTGNGHDSTLTTGSTLSTTTTNNPFGLPWPDFTKAEILTLSNSAQMLNSSPMHISAWINADVQSGANGVVGNRYDNSIYGDDNWFQFQSNAQAFVKGDSSEDLVSGTGASGIVYLSVGHDASSLQVYRNGTLVGQDTTIVNTLGILSEVGQDYRIGSYFSASPSQRYDGRVAEVKLAKYKPLPEKISTEYANQSDPATFYGTPSIAGVGGGVTGVNASVAATLPKLTASAILEATLPQPDFSVAATLPKLTASAILEATQPIFDFTVNASLPKLEPSVALEASLPQPDFTVNASLPKLEPSVALEASLSQSDLTVSASLPKLSASVLLEASLPQPDFTVNASLPKLEPSVALEASLPQPDFTVNASLPKLEPSAALEATIAGWSIQVAATLPKLESSVMMEASLPQPDFTVNASLPKLEPSAALEATQPIFDFTVSASLPKLEAAAVFEATLPQPDLSSTFAMPKLQVSATLSVSGVVITTSYFNNITMLDLSNNINQRLD